MHKKRGRGRFGKSDHDGLRIQTFSAFLLTTQAVNPPLPKKEEDIQLKGLVFVREREEEVEVGRKKKKI